MRDAGHSLGRGGGRGRGGQPGQMSAAGENFAQNIRINKSNAKYRLHKILFIPRFWQKNHFTPQKRSGRVWKSDDLIHLVTVCEDDRSPRLLSIIWGYYAIPESGRDDILVDQQRDVVIVFRTWYILPV